MRTGIRGAESGCVRSAYPMKLSFVASTESRNGVANEVQILLNTRKITFGDIFAPLRLVSELPDLRGANANRYPGCRKADTFVLHNR